MPFSDTCGLAFFALVIEAVAGYPDGLWRTIGHPVSWIGRIIAHTEGRLNRPAFSPAMRRTSGYLALLFWLGLALAVSLGIVALLPDGVLGLLIAAILASSLLAQRSLHAHVAAVASALDRSLDDGRAAVAQIVGRDVQSLDAAGVARAAIESLAENFSDGIVAPVFWISAAGLPGGALYKTINTADSIVGHRSARYADFGFASAKLDDIVNWPAARLSALLLCAAALPDVAAMKGAWQAMLRDARGHRSPNAGWPEAAAAGALGLRLAGPRVYDGVRVDDPFMGEGRADANAADIRRALSLYRRACLMLWVLVAGLAVAFA